MTNWIPSALLAGITSAFAGSSNQPWTENTTPAVTPENTACTVRLNKIHGEESTIFDERYIGTKHEDQVSYAWPHSGISYIQNGTIEGTQPTEMELSFQTDSGLHNWLMPDGQTYYHSDTWAARMDENAGQDKTASFALSFLGTKSVLYDSKYTNWDVSVEVDIENPTTCLNIRNEMETPQEQLPQFYALGRNSNDWAEKLWSQTGYPEDVPTLIGMDGTNGVTIIPREERLKQDHASGQLLENYDSIAPPWKPQ